MKHLTKICALLFVFVFLLTACGKAGAGLDPSEITDLDFESDVKDLLGAKIKVCGDIGEESKTILSFDKDRVLADTIKSRFSEVENKFNCKFVKTRDITSIEEVVRANATGSSPVDFFVEFIFYGGDEFKKGELVPMSEVSDYIDIHDSFRWGNPNNLEIFARDGELYGVYPASWPETNVMSTDFLLVYNAEILNKELNLDDPRQYYEQKKWTPDFFADYVKQCTIQRGSDEKPIYGLSAGGRHLVDISLKAFGAYPARRDENGNWIKGYNNDAGIQALNYAARFAPKGNLNDYVIIQGVSESTELWANSGCTICMLHSNFTFSQAGTDSSNLVTTCGIEYGIMPYPSMNGELIAQYERCINAIAIPRSAEDPELSARLINELFAPLPGFETEEDLISYYAGNLVFSEKDATLIVNMTKNSRYLFHDEGFNTMHTEVYSNLDRKTPTEILNNREEKFQKLIDESVIPSYETIEKLFGYQY